jgi:hypothetical protein
MASRTRSVIWAPAVQGWLDQPAKRGLPLWSVLAEVEQVQGMKTSQAEGVAGSTRYLCERLRGQPSARKGEIGVPGRE